MVVAGADGREEYFWGWLWKTATEELDDRMVPTRGV